MNEKRRKTPQLYPRNECVKKMNERERDLEKEKNKLRRILKNTVVSQFEY